MKVILILFIVVNCNYVFAQKIKSRENAFNPDIGINVLFLSQDSKIDKSEDGIGLQEVELQFSSDIDAYFTAKVLMSVSEESGVYGIEPEEAYVETIALSNVTVKVGKTKMPFGKHNQLHSHAFPFINAPLVNEIVLGEEGLNETGLGLSGLIPLPWFSELSLDYTQGEHADLFNNSAKENKLIVGHFKNHLELSDSTTLEFGVSGAKGKNSSDLETKLFGMDLTLKWRSQEGGRNHSFEWMSEYIEKDRKGAIDGQLSGAFSYLKYQLARRWYIQYRFDHLGLNDSKTISAVKRQTGLVAFLPSEFSGIRLQYETINDDAKNDDEVRVSLQFNISMGTHPAHAY